MITPGSTPAGGWRGTSRRWRARSALAQARCTCSAGPGTRAWRWIAADDVCSREQCRSATAVILWHATRIAQGVLATVSQTGANEHLSRRIRLGRNSIHRGPRTVPGRLSNRANRAPAGSGARHRRTRALDGSGLCGRASGREATGVWLLQHRHGNRTSFQSGIRLLAFARVSKQEGCGGGQECHRNCGGGRRASVALRIRSPKHCPAGR